MKRTTVFTMLLLSVLILLVDTSLAHITASTPVDPDAKVYPVDLPPSGLGIETYTKITLKTGPHEAGENHSHLASWSMHHIIALDANRNITLLFQYWGWSGSMWGDRTSSPDPIKSTRSVVAEDLWGYAWVSGALRTDGVEPWDLSSNMDSDSLTVESQAGANAPPINAGAAVAPFDVESDSFIQDRNQGLEELSEAIESAKATDSLVVSAANLDGRIYTFRRDSVYVLEDADGVAQVTIGDPDAEGAQVIRLSPTDGSLSQVSEAPRAPKPRARIATTTWASIKKASF